MQNTVFIVYVQCKCYNTCIMYMYMYLMYMYMNMYIREPQKRFRPRSDHVQSTYAKEMGNACTVYMVCTCLTHVHEHV